MNNLIICKIMGNICDNVIFVSFPEGSTTEVKEQFIADVKIDLEVNDYDEEGLEEYDNFEMNISSNWTAPIERLTELAKKYRLKIIGVSYEFGLEYVSTIEINEKEG